MTVPGQPTVTYTYDALDRRTSRSAGGTSETYGYVGLSATVGRIDRGGGQVLASAIDALGDRLTVGSSWVLPSVRGDVAALLAPGGTAVGDAHRYDPYGVTLAASGSTASPWRFAGRLQEPTSGQYDYGARGYDPALAAFTSLDTALGAAAAPASRNRYLYAEANPVSMVDPDGHAACRLGADDCADLGGRLDALARAAAAADAAAAA
ncbi:MAG: RHS repeat-associated core domain-containing protein, partial [Chloroflexi bacterium]|nr:RHS repeat-associated core domain-containing protein [Chloroflexota bacterium]